MTKPIFITGIGTGVGKTIVSAILVEKLRADYWKPVQSGDLDNSDTMMVKKLVSNPISHFFSETYRLTQPYSPHKSAAFDGIEIDAERFIIPQTNNQLIIEGAGGLMVPLNNRFLMIDLIQQLGAEVVLVAKNYLGSINHSLLSIEALKARNIKIRALVFNGERDEYSEQVIKMHAQAEQVIYIPQLEALNKASIAHIVDDIKL